MAWTQTDLDRLKSAIAQGVRTITYSDGRSHTFHSLAEMMRIKAAIEAEIASASAAPEPRAVLISTARDW